MAACLLRRSGVMTPSSSDTQPQSKGAAPTKADAGIPLPSDEPTKTAIARPRSRRASPHAQLRACQEVSDSSIPTSTTAVAAPTVGSGNGSP